jgi:hypothetical protein
MVLITIVNGVYKTTYNWGARIVCALGVTIQVWFIFGRFVFMDRSSTKRGQREKNKWSLTRKNEKS